ncbi:MAG: glycosyltransferase family 39 protein [Acidobacteriota bacterium]
MSEQSNHSVTEEQQFIGNLQSTPAIFILCVIALSAVVVLPFFWMGKSSDGRRWYEGAPPVQERDDVPAPVQIGMPETHDMAVHFDQMRSFYVGLASGVAYPRWEEDTNRGFGAPTMTYYSPAIYYLTSFFYKLTGDWRTTLICVVLLIMLASAGALYLYARRTLSPVASAMATIIYVIAPYHLIDQYQRGAIAELMSFIWMPLILYFIDRLLEEQSTEPEPSTSHTSKTFSSFRLFALVGLAASYGAMLWSHVPTTFQFSLALGVMTPLLAWLRRDWRGLIWIGAAIFLGVGLAAAYLYPAVTEQHLIRSDLLNGDIPYETTYLFSQTGNGFENFSRFSELLNHTWFFNLAIILIAITIFFAYRQVTGVSQAIKFQVWVWLSAGLLASFLMLSVSDFIRKAIPKFDIGVFSWRMLSISTLVAALVVGVIAQMAVQHRSIDKQRRLLIYGFLAACMLSSAGFSLVRVILPMRDFQYFVSRKEHLNRIMLPKDVPILPRQLPVINPAELIKPSGEIAIETWEPHYRKLKVNVPESNQLVIRTFDFPGWTTTLDNQPASLSKMKDFGAIVVNIPAGSHQIELRFLDTKVRWTGKLVNGCAVAVALLLVGWGYKQQWAQGKIVNRKGDEQPVDIPEMVK